MPKKRVYNKSTGRDYKKEYAKIKAGKWGGLKAQVKRHAARRAYEKKHGDLPSTTEIDHRRSIDRGGGNRLSNLRAIPRSQNRGFKRDSKNNPRN